ncbi:MAG: MBL fold metallo-hydrolase [Methylophilaceae bacterium]|nr:MBL fold metallo-hydrolase [Methylophilaceae bacterium]
MKFCSLGSGSSGNCYLLSDAKETIIIDCGFNASEFERRLKRFEINPSSLTAILLTHEHDDHSKSIFSVAHKLKIPIFLTHGTFKMCHKKITKSLQLDLRFIKCLEVFRIGNISVTPIPVPHDAREPVQFKFQSNGKTFAIITDLGFGNKILLNEIHHLDGLILESNHDDDLLKQSRYPKSLKERISGMYGHLSNQESAKILNNIDTKRLSWLGASHLSKENNTAELVTKSWQKVLKNNLIDINIIDQDNGVNWVSL